MGSVRIIRTRFTEDDIVDGDIRNPEIREELSEGLTVEEAVDLIKSAGLTFAATGNDWAADPDGSTVVDYRTLTREAATAHLVGWDDEAFIEIVDAVG